MTNTSPRYITTRSLVLHLYLFSLLWVIFYFAVSKHLSLYGMVNGTLNLTDFAHYMKMGEGFLFEGINIYSAEGRNAVFQALSHAPVESSLSVSVPPPGFIVWAPIVALARWNINIAHATFVSLSLYLLGLGLFSVFSRVGLFNVRGAILLAATVGTFVSWTGFSCLLIGQTAIAMCGLLILVGVQGSRGEWHLPTLLAAFLYSCIKPHYFVILLFLVAVLGIPRRILFKSLLAPLLVTSVALGTSFNTVPAYLENVSKFVTPLDSQMNAFRSSYAPKELSIFRSSALTYLGDNGARHLSLSFFALFSAASLWWAAHARGRSYSNAIAAWGAFLFTYLLFAPYVGEYENILILSFIAIALGSWSAEKQDALAVLLGLGAVMSHTKFSTLDSLWVFWTIKFLFLLYLCAATRRRGTTSRLTTGK